MKHYHGILGNLLALGLTSGLYSSLLVNKNIYLKPYKVGQTLMVCR